MAASTATPLLPEDFESIEARDARAIGDLTKDFSVCAKSFGHPELAPKSSPKTSLEDDSGKDCL